MRKPEALLLADELAQTRPHIAAAELRRQHALIGELVEALENLLDDTQHVEHADCEEGPCCVREARAVLSKAKEQQS